MQNKEDIIPVGGLNTDDDPRHFQQGDYQESRNLHTGSTQEQGNEGLVSSIVSTAELILPAVGGGGITNWHHLGVAKDEENDRAYILWYVEASAVEYFVIVKQNLLDDTFKNIVEVLATQWNINAWDDDMQKCYNPRIVDNNLIFTDNQNDIRMIDVVKMETTKDAGIDKVVVFFNYGYSEATGYLVDDLIYYLNKVYIVIQNTIGSGAKPTTHPLYFTEIATIEDVYLDPTNPDNFTLAALPPLISPVAQYFPDTNRRVNQLRGKVWEF